MRRDEACDWLIPDDPEQGYPAPEQQAAHRRMMKRLSRPLDMPSIFEIMVEGEQEERRRHESEVPRRT